jgi:DNA-binding CsgD family transcriptional regulator
MGASTDQMWYAARARKMTRLADQGMSTSEIADALGLTRKRIHLLGSGRSG